jgi:hypothetical protein
VSLGTRISKPDFLEYTAINKKFGQEFPHRTDTYQSPASAFVHQGRCSVRRRYSQIKGSTQQAFAFQTAISQFNGYVDVIDLAGNPFLIPSSSVTLSVPRAHRHAKI